MHTTGGYLLGAALTVKYVFDLHPDDKADIGWFTTVHVHSSQTHSVTLFTARSRTGSPPSCSSPLLSTVYPTPSHYWETVAKFKLTQFYSAPTAIVLCLTTLRAMISASYVSWEVSVSRSTRKHGTGIRERWKEAMRECRYFLASIYYAVLELYLTSPGV
jgi:acyl-coenzyme A synthetase/AMP-(fatty) acid ligase